jgi:hypothetical protein
MLAAIKKKADEDLIAAQRNFNNKFALTKSGAFPPDKKIEEGGDSSLAKGERE